MITCKLCNVNMKRVTSSHLKKHGISSVEYLQQFPNAKLFSDELRYAYGKSARENNPMKNNEIIAKVSSKLKGIPKSKEHKEKLSESRMGVSWGNHNEEHKEKMRVISKNNMIKRLESGWKPPKWTNARRQKHSNKMIGNTYGTLGNHNKGKKLRLTTEQRANRSKKRVDYMKQNKTLKINTSIEREFKLFCKTNKVQFIHQYAIHTNNGSWLYDFFIPNLNLLVELDGEYWHSSTKQINRDIIKNSIALEHGYTILRLTDKYLKFDLIFSDPKIILNHTRILMECRISQSKKSSGNDNP